jgi:glyoxylase-like metal-dependent hydrolase (beta-lactamase superfamily II)
LKLFKSKIVRVLLVLLLVLVIGSAWLFSKMPKAGPARIQLTSNAVGIKTGNSYAWIIKTANGAMLIDSGMDSQAKAIIAELQNMNLKPDDVHTILLTHGHGDHWKGCLAFPKAKIMVEKQDIALIRGDRKPKGMMPAFFDKVIPKKKPPEVLHELPDSEILTVDGETFTVIHLPGHTTGSVAFLWNDILFSGDAFMGTRAGADAAPAMFSDDYDLNRESLKKLQPIQFKHAADGHTGIIEDAHKKLDECLSHKNGR